MGLQDVYAAQREALIDLLAGRGGDGTAPVPACPGWSVHDVLAHVVGLAGDAATGNLPVLDLLEQWRDDSVACARDAATGEQVDRGADRSIEDLASEWRALNPTLTPMLSGTVPFPDPAPFGLDAILVTDLTVHDQDVRSALGAPRNLDSPGLSPALATYRFGVDYRIRQLGLPALALHYDGRERVLGTGPVAARLRADRFELVRAFSGRRSRDQLLAYDWDGDPLPYVAIIPAYGERSYPLED